MRKMLKLAAALAILAAVSVVIWFAQGSARRDEVPAEGLVQVKARQMPASPAARIVEVATGAANLPAPPEKVIAQVRQAYPLLTEVDFRCGADGCAVTATIPPPTGEAFLAKRQEMLTGGLAKTIEANGYKTAGPVQMEEVAFNTFHIRASVAQAQARAM